MSCKSVGVSRVVTMSNSIFIKEGLMSDINNTSYVDLEYAICVCLLRTAFEKINLYKEFNFSSLNIR